MRRTGRCYIRDPTSNILLLTISVSMNAMAKFMDLSNELVIAIVSFIRKPADILQLCIADRRSHDIILPLLYENIVLHHLDYPTDRPHSLSSNVISLCRLFNHQQQNGRSGNSNGPDFGAGCRSLNINMHWSTRCNAYSVTELLSFLPFLRNLSFISSRRRFFYYGPSIKFPTVDLGQALHPLQDTLVTLTLYIGHEFEYCTIYGIGSLHRFKAMKQLCIQSPVLVGWGAGPSELSLSRLLPPKLEDLTIHCCTNGVNDTSNFADHFETRLDGEVSTRSFGSFQRFPRKDRRVIESVVVCMEDPDNWHSELALAFQSSRLASCFDIVGRNMDSADEN